MDAGSGRVNGRTSTTTPASPQDGGAPWRSLAGLAMVVAAAAAAASYATISQTIDEGAHIAAGLELLTRGTFTYEQQHPPLARLATALGPYLAGARAMGLPDLFTEGHAVLYGAGDHVRLLTLARLGVLPFLVLFLAATFLWGARELGAAGGAAAVVLAAALPSVLAHGGLATTDMPAAALLGLSMLLIERQLDRPDWRRTAALALAAACAVLAKLSNLAFLPACLVAAVLLRTALQGWPWLGSYLARSLAALPLAALVMAATAWAVYGFPRPPWEAFALFVEGIRHLLWHQSSGQWAYFMGEVSRAGWWAFFPIALAIKTPIPFLALAVVGLAFLMRDTTRPALAPLVHAAAVVAVAILSGMNGGLRYALALYVPLALLAASGLLRLAQSRRVALRAVAVALVLWQIGGAVAAYPDTLGWFNAIAGRAPERFLLDSDLDWGQDVRRAARELRRRGVERVWVALHFNGDLDREGFPPHEALPPYERRSGWIAVSETALHFHDEFAWLRPLDPVARVGASIRIYFVPGS